MNPVQRLQMPIERLKMRIAYGGNIFIPEIKFIIKTVLHIFFHMQLVLVCSPRFFGSYIKQMKILYTILFFIDTLLLILLSFILLKMIDEGVNITKLIFMLSAIILSIVTLIFFLRRYLKVSASGSHN